MPQAEKAVGVRRKLIGYSLDIANEVGGPKARGFERILGITISDAEYLEGAILTGILVVPCSAVRDNPPYGISCVVNVRTAWLLTDAGDPPRMTTAFPRP